MRVFFSWKVTLLSRCLPLEYDDDDVELNVLGCRVDLAGENCDQCVSMVQCCFTSTETLRLNRTGSPGWPPRVQELCETESRSGQPLVLMSRMVSVDVKQH